jgi:HAD superfamily hydrolase (TIGR01509 family)
MRLVPGLIIFDCDGVLIDSEVLSCRCLSELLQTYGADVSVEDVMRLFLGRSQSAILEYFAERGLPLPPGFSDALQARVSDSFSSELRAIEGVSAVLDLLDVPFCVASSSNPKRLALSLSLTGLSRYFSDKCFTSELVSAGKPAPDLFLYAANAMGVQPQNVLVIEDSINGVRAGKAAQMTVWGFVGGSHHQFPSFRPSLVDAGADKIIKSMSELMDALGDLTS